MSRLQSAKRGLRGSGSRAQTKAAAAPNSPALLNTNITRGALRHRFQWRPIPGRRNNSHSRRSHLLYDRSRLEQIRRMQKTAQAWFTGAPSGGGGSGPYQPQKPSLLADWNAYAATADASSDSLLGFDIESAVRTANDKVSGTFDVVSKGVKELPGSLHSATSNVMSGTSLMYFGVLLATGLLFIFIAFTMFLPVMVLVPQKFAICFTVGSAFVVASFFPLKGAKYQLDHMLSKERLPFTVGFIGSMVGTVYVSMVVHSYVLSVLFSVLQVLALSYYVVSYFPGGSTGLKFISSALTSSIMKCFGR